MALLKTKKAEVINETVDLLTKSKLTVIVQYQGLTVKELQSLRKLAEANKTTVRVIKNRLVQKALAQIPQFKNIDNSQLTGMLAYCFNSDDEVAPAQVISDFLKNNADRLSFWGGITQEGQWLASQQVEAISKLPSREIMLASIVNILTSPIQTISSTLNNQLPGVVAALEQAKS